MMTWVMTVTAWRSPLISLSVSSPPNSGLWWGRREVKMNPQQQLAVGEDVVMSVSAV